jgi:hypothetical protein
MSTRPSLGFDDEEAPAAPAAATVLDLSGFQPKSVTRPDKEKVAEAAQRANFKSREAKPAMTLAPVARQSRRRRTGRSAQLNLKVKPETITAFYAIADSQGWVLGEAFERAVDLLEKSLDE